MSATALIAVAVSLGSVVLLLSLGKTTPSKKSYQVSQPGLKTSLALSAPAKS